MVGTETVNYTSSARADGDDPTTAGRATAPTCSRSRSPIQATRRLQVTLLDNVLHPAVRTTRRYRCHGWARPTPSPTADGTSADGHADRPLRRRRADGDGRASQIVAEGATVTGTGLRGGRRRRVGDAHQRHGAGVRPGDGLLAGDRHWRGLDQGEGRRLVLVHGGCHADARGAVPRSRRPSR